MKKKQRFCCHNQHWLIGNLRSVYYSCQFIDVKSSSSIMAANSIDLNLFPLYNLIVPSNGFGRCGCQFWSISFTLRASMYNKLGIKAKNYCHNGKFYWKMMAIITSTNVRNHFWIRNKNGMIAKWKKEKRNVSSLIYFIWLMKKKKHFTSSEWMHWCWLINKTAKMCVLKHVLFSCERDDEWTLKLNNETNSEQKKH